MALFLVRLSYVESGIGSVGAERARHGARAVVRYVEIDSEDRQVCDQAPHVQTERL